MRDPHLQGDNKRQQQQQQLKYNRNRKDSGTAAILVIFGCSVSVALRNVLLAVLCFHVRVPVEQSAQPSRTFHSNKFETSILPYLTRPL